MTTRIPIPTNSLSIAGLPVLAERLAAVGWRIESAARSRPGRAAFALLARDDAEGVATKRDGARAGDPAPPARSVLVHGFIDVSEVRLADLWMLIAQVNEMPTDAGAICLGAGVRLSKLADATARRLGVNVIRLSA